MSSSAPSGITRADAPLPVAPPAEVVPALSDLRSPERRFCLSEWALPRPRLSESASESLSGPSVEEVPEWSASAACVSAEPSGRGVPAVAVAALASRASRSFATRSCSLRSSASKVPSESSSFLSISARRSSGVCAVPGGREAPAPPCLDAEAEVGAEGSGDAGVDEPEPDEEDCEVGAGCDDVGAGRAGVDGRDVVVGVEGIAGMDDGDPVGDPEGTPGEAQPTASVAAASATATIGAAAQLGGVSATRISDLSSEPQSAWRSPSWTCRYLRGAPVARNRSRRCPRRRCAAGRPCGCTRDSALGQ